MCIKYSVCVGVKFESTIQIQVNLLTFWIEVNVVQTLPLFNWWNLGGVADQEGEWWKTDQFECQETRPFVFVVLSCFISDTLDCDHVICRLHPWNTANKMGEMVWKHGGKPKEITLKNKIVSFVVHLFCVRCFWLFHLNVIPLLIWMYWMHVTQIKTAFFVIANCTEFVQSFFMSPGLTF